MNWRRFRSIFFWAAFINLVVTCLVMRFLHPELTETQHAPIGMQFYGRIKSVGEQVFWAELIIPIEQITVKAKNLFHGSGLPMLEYTGLRYVETADVRMMDKAFFMAEPVDDFREHLKFFPNKTQ